jgi:hypothetical protein
MAVCISCDEAQKFRRKDGCKVMIISASVGGARGGRKIKSNKS